MGGTPGPFQIIEEDRGPFPVDTPIEPPRRNYSCQYYETCLNVACALNWDSFTCKDCSGEVNETYMWRARQAARKDKVAGKLCDLPSISLHSSEDEPSLPHVRIAGEK